MPKPSAPVGPDISYSTGMGVPRQLQANVIGPIDRELGSAIVAARPDMRGLRKASEAHSRLLTHGELTRGTRPRWRRRRKLRYQAVIGDLNRERRTGMTSSNANSEGTAIIRTGEPGVDLDALW
jgi:hypothetical protein